MHADFRRFRVAGDFLEVFLVPQCTFVLQCTDVVGAFGAPM